MGIKFTFGKITIDSVVSSVQQAINDLGNISGAKAVEYERSIGEIAKLHEKAASLHDEIARANRIQDKLKDLIS